MAVVSSTCHMLLLYIVLRRGIIICFLWDTMNYTGQAKGQHAGFLINESSDQMKISYFLYYKCVQTFPHMDLQKLSSDWPWIKEEAKWRSSASLSTKVQSVTGKIHRQSASSLWSPFRAVSITNKAPGVRSTLLCAPQVSGIGIYWSRFSAEYTWS